MAESKLIKIRRFEDLQDYEKILNKMIEHAKLVSEGKAQEEIWLLQFNPVYTGGTSFNADDIIDLHGVPFYKTGRGGKITFHGPGQEICYPILNMKTRSERNVPDVKKFVHNIEEVVIKTLESFNIKAYRKEGMIGVWTLNEKNNREEKIAAIGIRFSRGVSMHGFSLNIDTDLSYFKRIMPCGISDFGVCSIKSLGGEALRQEVQDEIIKSFQGVFGFGLEEKLGE